MCWNRGNRARSVLACFLSLTLVFSLSPFQASASQAVVGELAPQGAKANGDETQNQGIGGTDALLIGEILRTIRMKAIDSQPESYEAGQVIVVHRGDAAGEGASARVATLPGASCELLADGRGIAPGAGASSGEPERGEVSPTPASVNGEKADKDAGFRNPDGGRPSSVSLVEVPDGMSVGEAVVRAENTAFHSPFK